ncbi:MAG TPA: hypothetical protein VHO23_03115 [Candidatus Paceibacterota bacterium]|nr:hypothetical protein [Candidatus Paceibacterota bacterium]
MDFIMTNFRKYRSPLAVIGALTLVGLGYFVMSGADFTMSPVELVISLIALVVGAAAFMLGLALLDLGSFRERTPDDATYAEVAQARLAARREQVARLYADAREKSRPYLARMRERALELAETAKLRFKTFRTPATD